MPNRKSVSRHYRHAVNEERLGPEDLAILAAESATIAGHTCKTIVCEGPAPDLDELRSRLVDRLAGAPRCCQCLSGEAAGAASWVDDPSFSIADHVRAAPDPDEPLLAAVARAMSTRLDRGRSLWDVELHTDVGDGRWALVWRVHHAMADGMTAMRWAADLFWDDAVEQPHGPAVPPMAEAAAGARAGAVARSRALLKASLALARELRPSSAPGPFRGLVGARRQVAFVRCSLGDLRGVEHGIGGGVTLNDVVLSVVAGGIRRWSDAVAVPVRAARVKVPVSMHVGADAAGNRDSLLFVDLPVGEDDPLERLAQVNRETAERKSHHDADTLYATLEDLRRASPSLATLASRLLMSPHEFFVNVSNVRGPQSPLTVLGRPVQELYSVAEIAPRHPLRIAVTSLSGAMSFGLCADPELVTGLDVLAAGIEASISELVAAV
jgi:diacylglycerol O-acyltransferase / wax synthase